MKLLTFSTLFPSQERPNFGVFVENRLRHLLNDFPVESRVVAPVPWFPLKHPRFGEYATYARVPDVETRHGIKIVHPRYLLLPKIGMSTSPLTLALAARASLEKIRREGYDFDVIDAHYFYPDGVAAALLGKWFDRPVVITARGTDLNLIPQYRLPRNMIQWAAQRSSGLITVCKALKDVLVNLNVPADKVTVLRNGVDLRQFMPPQDRDALRAKLGLTGMTLLSVGGLIERKGHHLIIEALNELPNVSLLIAGGGPDERALGDLITKYKLHSRVRMLGSVGHAVLKDYYGAADALVLGSSREGWANVLLEAMACGTPVVATNVWGTPEVVAAAEAGVLVERSPSGIAEGVKRLFKQLPARDATRRYAERFDWHATSQGQYELFGRIQHATRERA